MLADWLWVLGIVGTLFCGGFAVGAGWAKDYHYERFVLRHAAEPYCQTAEIADQAYKRCWKAVEVARDP